MYLFVGDYNDRGIEGSIAGMIIALRHNKYIQEKKSGNISSYYNIFMVNTPYSQ